MIICITPKGWKKMTKAYNKKYNEHENIDFVLNFHVKHVDGFVYPNINMIGLNLRQIEKSAILNNIDFYKFVCNTISHEFIHLWIDKHVDIDTSNKLDNIAKKYVEYGLW